MLHDGEVVGAAAGVLSRTTGVEATVDSLFQIGSVTKVWTATLVMQLADEGLLDLDAPVVAYLPELRVIGSPEAELVTARQLLAHTSGLDGDVFTDIGPGDDCIERYVATLGGLAQLFAPGEMFSYSNTAYSVLGRLLEVVREKSFDACLREHLIDPLGLQHAATGPYEAVLHRAAVGHLELSPGGGQQPTTRWALPRSTVGAGAHLAMSARDLLAFVSMHLDGGVAADGTRQLVGLEGDTLIAVEKRHGMHAPFAFVGDDGSGRAAYLHTGRADRRVLHP